MVNRKNPKKLKFHTEIAKMKMKFTIDKSALIARQTLDNH